MNPRTTPGRSPTLPLPASGLRTLAAARPRGHAITIDVDGDLVRAYEGEPVAAALFAEGIRVLARSPKYHRPRGLFCGTGHCGSCLMRIEGRPNVRACTTPATPGLRCERQNAFPDADVDLLAAADWMFPAGMDHHRLMTGSRLGNDLFVKLVRRMGGTGTLPDAPAPAYPPPCDEDADVCVVGGGPAGLAAARAIAEARPAARIMLIDDQDVLGGSLLAEPDGWARAQDFAAAARAAGVEILGRTSAIGVYLPEGQAPADNVDTADIADTAAGVLAAVTPAGLWRIRARRFLYTTGAYEQNLPVLDNDRPGIVAARALGRLVFQWGIAPAGSITVVAADPLVTAVDGFAAYLERLAHGLRARGLQVGTASPAGIPKVDRHNDVIAMGAMPAPASELPRQHGASVRFDLVRGGFCVGVDAQGKCGPGVFCAGDVTGYAGPEQAAQSGARVGDRIAAGL